MKYRDLVDRYYRDFHSEEFSSELMDFHNTKKENNQVLWVGTDSEELFKGNYRRKLEKRTLEYYIKNPIVYKVNNLGFRDVELDELPDVIDLYLGCSQTFGVGLHRKHIWSTKVAEHLNYPSFNAGIPGSGAMTQFRLLEYIFNKKKIRTVFHYLPITHARYEWFDGINYIGTSVNKPHFRYKNGDMPLWLDENLSTLLKVYYNATENLCNLNNTQYIAFTDETVSTFLPDEESFEERGMLARDLQHNSVDKNHQMYLHIVRKYAHLVGNGENISYL